MTDNELLLAISSMMDEKLKGENAGIQEEIQSLKEEMHSMKDEVRRNIIMRKETFKNLIELVPEVSPEPDELVALLEGREDRKKMAQFRMML